MPTEAVMRAEPLHQFHIGNEQVVWYDEQLNLFFVAPADSGDPGDAAETYDELLSLID